MNETNALGTSRLLLLREAEAREILAISRAKLFDLVSRGQIPHVKIGRSLRFRPSDLEKFANDHLVVT